MYTFESNLELVSLLFAFLRGTTEAKMVDLLTDLSICKMTGQLVIYPSFISGLINFWQPIPDIYPPKGRLSEYRLYQGVSTQN